MRIFRDVTFDESRPFYPRPSSSPSSTAMESISFLTPPDMSFPLSHSMSPPVSPPPARPPASLLPPTLESSLPSTPPPASPLPPPHESSPPSVPPPVSPLSPPADFPPSVLGHSPMVLRPRTITHVYTRRSRTPPSPNSSPLLLGSPFDLSP